MDRLQEYLRSNLQENGDLVTGRRLVAYSEYNDFEGDPFFFDQGQTIEQLLENRHRLIILGDAGMGKSTFLRQVLRITSQRALHQIENKDSQGECVVPYLLSLRNLSGKLQSWIDRCPATQHKAELAETRGMSLKPLFLLDGLDEISGRFVEKGVGKIISFVLASSDYFILTSRTVFFQFFKEKFLEVRMDAFHIAPLTSEEIEFLCLKNGCSHESLNRQSHYYGFSELLQNPQTLKFMIEVHRGMSYAIETKSELFRIFVRQRLKKNDVATTSDRYEILRDIALVLELVERNILSMSEFETLIKVRSKRDALHIERVYDDLNRSGVIVAEGNNIRFEHRSLGEFLAAERIAGEHLTRILNYVLFGGSNIIKPSWSNTLSFLIELHPALRQYCVSNFKLESIQATPNVFTREQKTRIFEDLYKVFCIEKPRFLYTEMAKVHRLSYFAPPSATKGLLSDLCLGNDWVKANAALLLGYIDTRKATSALKKVAFDRNNHRIVRLSALESLRMVGTNADIVDIKNELIHETKLKSDYAITVAALAGDKRVEDLMEVLNYLHGVVSMDVIDACRGFKTRAAMEKVLDLLVRNPNYLKGYELKPYMRRLLGNLKSLWSPSISGRVSHLLSALAKKHFWLEDEYQQLVVEAIEKNDPGRQVIKKMLKDPSLKAFRYHTLDVFIARCLTPELVPLILKKIKDPHSLADLAFEIRRSGNVWEGEIYELLKPRTAGILARYEEDVHLFKEKQTQERLERERQGLLLTAELNLAKDMSKVLRLAKAIPASDWPKLDEEQKEVLSRLITHHLAQTTAADNVKLISDKMWQANKLPFESSLLCLNMIDHYNLRLPDSTILVEHFLYGDEHTEKIVRYFKRNGLGPSDGRKIDALFRPELHEIALRPLMQVFAEFNVNVGLITEKLLCLVRDLDRDVQLRVDAFRRYIKISDADITPFLAETADSPDARLAHEAREELVKRQHIPTIMRLLADLLDGKFDIPRGPSWATGRNEIDWLDNINTANRAVWDALVKVTAHAIKNQQYGFLHVLLVKMSRMSLRGTLHVIQSRLGSATDSSLISMLEILENDLKNEELHELGRVKNVNDALEIIALTKPLRKVVIYVEGGNDRTLYKALQVKFCDRGLLPSDVQYFFSPKGGWSNIYKDRDNFGDWIDMNKPDPIFVLVDRDFEDTKMVSECEHLWQALKIPYHILKRKSPEKYYSPSLLTKVFGHMPISTNEIKNHTGQIAKTITLSDIEGTDLYEAFAVKLKGILS